MGSPRAELDGAGGPVDPQVSKIALREDARESEEHDLETPMRPLFTLLPLSLALACGKTDGKTDGEAKAEPVEASASAPADKTADDEGPRSHDLTKLGLKVEAPASAEVSDAIGGEGLMLQAPGLILTVEEAGEMTPKTLAEAKEQASMYSPENIKEETLEDGWAMTFENKGGMGMSYWVHVRREIDGTSYWCTTTAAQVEQQTNALAACKSLSK